MRILQLLYKTPYPLHDGGEYSLYHSALSLLPQPEVALKVFAMNLSRSPVEPEMLPEEFRKRSQYEQIDVDNRIKPWNAFLNLFSDESYFVKRFESREYETRLTQILKEGTFDIVLIEHIYLTMYVPQIRKLSKAKIVLRTQDIEYRLWESIIAQERNPFSAWYLRLCAKRLEVFERKAFDYFDGIIAFTETDKKEVQRSTLRPVQAIPIGFDAQRYDIVNSRTDQVTFYHLGSMDWRPNIQSMMWFVNEVLPLVVAIRSDVKVHIAGKNMPQWFFNKASENLIVEGRVPDSRAYQRDKSVLLVPLLSGSGIRVKIIEALAMGKSVISTDLGATGINCPTVFIANEASAFAEKILWCLESQDSLPFWSKQSREYAENNFDIWAVGRRKIAFFNSLRT